jgi:hypothetical protein
MSDTTMIAGDLERMLREDKSTIVKDYAILALGRAASADAAAAEAAFPLLTTVVAELGDKFASKALDAMTLAAETAPELASQALMYGYDYRDHDKASVKKAARALLRRLEKRSAGE